MTGYNGKGTSNYPMNGEPKHSKNIFSKHQFDATIPG